MLKKTNSCRRLTTIDKIKQTLRGKSIRIVAAPALYATGCLGKTLNNLAGHVLGHGEKCSPFLYRVTVPHRKGRFLCVRVKNISNHDLPGNVRRPFWNRRVDDNIITHFQHISYTTAGTT